MTSKERIDTLLVKQGLVDTREQAKRAIMAGLVFMNETRVEKPGTKIDDNAKLMIKENKPKYVGRGGFKLEKALETFRINIKDQTAIDIGASTGGFTDCMLQNGARKVYAVDVGYNQLAWKLRQDERVIVMERLNFRHADPKEFQADPPSFATIDVSFISLRLILPVLREIIVEDGSVVALVKPQFEAGKQDVGKKGIVRDGQVHARVLNDIMIFAKKTGFSVQGLTYSPITGGNGNIEFLLYLKHGKQEDKKTIPSPEFVVSEAHHELG